MYFKNILTLGLLITFGFSACLPSNVYEKNYSFKSHEWKSASVIDFPFTITDTMSKYAVYITLRHTDAYPYSNIWLRIKTTSPDNKTVSQQVELPLAQTSGKWLGRGMDEIYEHKISLTGEGSSVFNLQGQYVISLEHIMRENPLPQILNIGIRLEKIHSQ